MGRRSRHHKAGEARPDNDQIVKVVVRFIHIALPAAAFLCAGIAALCGRMFGAFAGRVREC